MTTRPLKIGHIAISFLNAEMKVGKIKPETQSIASVRLLCCRVYGIANIPPSRHCEEERRSNLYTTVTPCYCLAYTEIASFLAMTRRGGAI
jgi:hypothetical protein